MGEIIIRNAVERKSGMLYYINGNGDLCEAVMARKGRTTKKEHKKPDGKIKSKLKKIFG